MMTSNRLVNTVIVLIIAIFGVIGYKLAPLLRPNADITLPAMACNPGIKACAATLPNGARIELFIDPQPIRPLQTLNLNVTIHGLDAEKMEIDFEGTEMKMGYNRPALTRINGQFKGQAMLPVCVTGTMEWTATVLVNSGKQKIAIPFRFEVTGR